MPKGGVSNRQVKALNVLPGTHTVGEKRFKFLTFQELVARVDVSRCVWYIDIVANRTSFLCPHVLADAILVALGGDGREVHRDTGRVQVRMRVMLAYVGGYSTTCAASSCMTSWRAAVP
jgi:hypothetical protein